MIVLLAVATICSAQQGKVCSGMLQAGEELRYKVKWQFFRLGTITVRTERNPLDSLYYKVNILVESNPDLIFVKIRDNNEGLVNTLTMMSKQFYAVHQNNNERVEIRHEYDEQNRRVFYSNTDLNSGKLLRADTLVNAEPYVEGPGLFFYTRWQSRSKQIVKIPTMASGQMAETMLDFTHGREYIEIDAFNEPIRTRKYKGFAGWQGATSAGFSGEFFGWVSDDEAAIPIRAEMKVLLGSIRLELEQWNRPGWNPPLYVEIAKN